MSAKTASPFLFLYLLQQPKPSPSGAKDSVFSKRINGLKHLRLIAKSITWNIQFWLVHGHRVGARAVDEFTEKHCISVHSTSHKLVALCFNEFLSSAYEILFNDGGVWVLDYVQMRSCNDGIVVLQWNMHMQLRYHDVPTLRLLVTLLQYWLWFYRYLIQGKHWRLLIVSVKEKMRPFCLIFRLIIPFYSTHPLDEGKSSTNAFHFWSEKLFFSLNDAISKISSIRYALGMEQHGG